MPHTKPLPRLPMWAVMFALLTTILISTGVWYANVLVSRETIHSDLRHNSSVIDRAKTKYEVDGNRVLIDGMARSLDDLIKRVERLEAGR